MYILFNVGDLIKKILVVNMDREEVKWLLKEVIEVIKFVYDIIEEFYIKYDFYGFFWFLGVFYCSGNLILLIDCI